jgi:hypothetical protein
MLFSPILLQSWWLFQVFYRAFHYILFQPTAAAQTSVNFFFVTFKAYTIIIRPFFDDFAEFLK